MAIWRDEGDWRYELHPLDAPAAAFGRFESFVSKWRSKQRNAGLPAWSHFDLMDFEGWWGWVTVYDIAEREPFTIRVRLAGVHITEVLGYDPTGHVLSSVDDDLPTDARHITNGDLAYFEAVVVQRGIGLSYGPIDMEFHARGTFQEVALPLADDSVRIDRIMFAGSIDSVTYDVTR